MQQFVGSLKVKLEQINRRLRDQYEADGVSPAVFSTRLENNSLWVEFPVSSTESKSISIPIPYQDEFGNLVVGKRVVRAVGTWMIEEKEYTYWELMEWLLISNIEIFRPDLGKRCQLERLVRALYRKDTAFVFRGVQEVIDSVVHSLPLCGTPLETWAMCHRVVIIDPTFDNLTPENKLQYQKEANRKYFPWTSLGLSDSSMTNNNLLKVDVRTLTPFGLRHHNPQRNLYQTLGMRGDELPCIISESAARLESRGIGHRGWNWLTCFLDLPGTFEDQLLVDIRHQDLFTSEEQNIICFGEVDLQVGQSLSMGDPVSKEPNGEVLRFNREADSAVVADIYKDTLPFNGSPREVTVVHVVSKHLFKEGIKLTNRHGNKGVVVFADLGVLIDPQRGELPIDLIVSAKTIGKRRNYGQVLEALTTMYRGKEERLTVSDMTEVNVDKLRNSLATKGYQNGTCHVKTPWGEFDTLAGWCFWGLIRNPESQRWTEEDVTATDNRGLRRAGTKISHIELKAFTTMFGANNALVKEILSYQQGVDDVKQLLLAVDLMRGKHADLPVMPWLSFKPLDQKGSFFHTAKDIAGTVADERIFEDGFLLELPRTYHIFIPDSLYSNPEESLLPKEADLNQVARAGGDNVFLDKIFIPGTTLRGSWQHSTGLWGLSDLAGHVNNIIKACYMPNGEEKDSALFLSIYGYFNHLAKRLGTKAGELANHCLSVRYPNSAKATATLAIDDLPHNWIEIHEDLAQTLQVSTGDIIIAERFPCLGFMSLRPQKVRVTNDPNCRYVVRVSGNSLVSQNLDFDGDVLFLMSFHSPEARALLENDFENPEPTRQYYISRTEDKKKPITAPLSLNDFQIETFPDLTAERQSEIVADLTGVKRGTGSVVAMAYNVMRIVEGAVGSDDIVTNVAIEVILDMVANSVFSRKHAGTSLAERCKEAICTADLNAMLEMGFPEDGSKRLCEIIREKAESIGVKDLKEEFNRHLTDGKSTVINRIIKRKHRLYFATRSANLHPVRILEHLESPGNDLCAALFLNSGVLDNGMSA